MQSMIYEPSPHRGWLPWVWLAPAICILLVALSSVPIDLLMEQWDLVDAKGDPLTAPAFCLFLLLPFASMAAATYAWSRYVERRGVETLGLGGSARLRKFLGGVIIGIAMMGLAISAIWLAGGYRAEASFPAFASASSLFWIAVLLPCFAFQSSVEEFIFRGWLLSSVTRRWNLAAGIVATSLAFTFLHYSPHQPLRVTCLSFLFSVFACAWARRANSIWGVMGWHTGWNWFAGVGFGVPITGLDVHLPALLEKLVPIGPDYLTGGFDGPEGSVLTLALFAIASLALFALPANVPPKPVASGV
ncbi:MAG TPA: type II CAAX endopeptidase family protein [Croceibacterium sp.]